MSADTATIVYSYFFVTVAAFAGLSYVAKHYVAKETEDVRDSLARIETAVFNGGHGMEAQIREVNEDIKEMKEKQQRIFTDIAVLSTKLEERTGE